MLSLKIHKTLQEHKQKDKGLSQENLPRVMWIVI